MVSRTTIKYFLLVGSLSACMKSDRQVCNYIESYYQKIYEAELKYQMEEFEEARDLYKSAFKICLPINTPVYNEIGKYAKVCAILGNNEEALEYIQLDITNGSLLKWYLQDTIYREVFATKEGNRLKEIYDNTRTQYLTTINIKLRKEIQEMNRLDQYYRIPAYYESKQDSIDRINEIRLVEIFETIGYPNSKIIGTGNIDGMHTDIVAILLHTDDSIRISYFIPKLMEFVMKGECPPQVLGNLIDQHALYNDLPQTHGTYRSQNTRYANMIANREIVNKNRASIGLPSLELEEKIDSLRSKRMK